MTHGTDQEIQVMEISAKDYNKVQRARKLHGWTERGGPLYLKGINGKYYKTTGGGARAAIVMAHFERELNKANSAQQLTLL